MKVLIADAIAPEAREGLEALGLEVEARPQLSANGLAGKIGDADCLVVTGTAVTRRTIESASSLSLIIHAGRGTGEIDVTAASEHGVLVSHCPDTHAPARAEYALHLMGLLDRAADSNGHWAPIGLAGRTLGLYGLSATAHHLAKMASTLGMAVHAHAPDQSPTITAEAGLAAHGDPDSLLDRCDVVSVHGADEGLLATLGEPQLESLGPDGILIAVEATGGLDLKAVVKAAEKGLRVGVDVPSGGLKSGDARHLKALEKLPHGVVGRDAAIGTLHAQRAMATAVVRIAHGYLVSGIAPAVTNLQESTEGACTLVIRHKKGTAAVLATLDVLQDEKIAMYEMRNHLFQNGLAAYFHVRLGAVPRPDIVQRIVRHQDVIQADVVHDG